MNSTISLQAGQIVNFNMIDRQEVQYKSRKVEEVTHEVRHKNWLKRQ